MKRKVCIYEISYLGSQVKVLVENYNSAMVYPTDLIKFDINFNTLVSKSRLDKYIQEYINLYIYGILGREGSLSGDIISASFNKYIPQYDLSIYPVGKDLELEFDGYELIQDTEVVDTKDRLLDLVENSETVDEIVDGIKAMFNLVDADTGSEEINPVGKTPRYVRPTSIDEIADSFSQFLSDKSYIKGNYIEFELPNPISDFKNGNSDTELMAKIRQFYSDWDSIDVSEKTINSIVPSEVYPIADPNIYMKVGSNYVKVVPSDIQIQVGGSYINLFQAGPTVPRLVVTDGTNQIDLTLNNLRYLDSGGVASTLSGVRYRSQASGEVGSDLYFKDSSGNYQSVTNLSKSLAMFKFDTVSTTSTVFKFYFK